MSTNGVITPASGPPSSIGDYKSTWGVSEQYIVTLSVSGKGGLSENISTSIDETFSINLGSQWAAPFENVIQEAVTAAAGKGGVLGKTAAASQVVSTVFGIPAKSRYTSAQVWQGSDPIHLTIPFTFIAIKDAKTDVRDKVLKLLKMVAPSSAGGLLFAPGPTLMSAALSGRDITLRVGTFLELKNCIITDVQCQFDNMMGHDGIPLKAKVNVDVKSFFSCFTTQDLDALFKQGGEGSGIGAVGTVMELAKRLTGG